MVWTANATGSRGVLGDEDDLLRAAAAAAAPVPLCLSCCKPLLDCEAAVGLDEGEEEEGINDSGAIGDCMRIVPQ